MYEYFVTIPLHVKTNEIKIVTKINNLVIDHEKDYQHVTINHPKAREMILEIILELDLVDCWREEHTDERKYTWLKHI